MIRLPNPHPLEPQYRAGFVIRPFSGPLNGAARTLKLCELCGGWFARLVGSNRIICDECGARPYLTGPRERDERVHRAIVEERKAEEKKFRRVGATHPRTGVVHKRRKKADAWVPRLVKAFNEKGQLLKKEIDAIMGVSYSSTVQYAKSLGIPIVQVGRLRTGRRGRSYAIYGLKGALPSHCALGDMSPPWPPKVEAVLDGESGEGPGSQKTETALRAHDHRGYA